MTPYIIVLAAILSVAAYGLQRRTLWARYGGWVIFFLAAGIYCTYAYSALYSAETGSATVAAFLYIAGGAVLWVPAAVWWCGCRKNFGRHKDSTVQSAKGDDRSWNA